MQSTMTLSADGRKPARTRKHVPLSFLLAGIAILGAVIYLVYVNTQTNAVYYVTVPELRHCTKCATQAVRVAGIVQAGSIKQNDKAQNVTFVIGDDNQTLQVSYSGVVPDIFRAGVQVVVEGRYSGSGPFQAQTLLAKCPSKFQAATPTVTQ
ncbi:MAG TPA: cytochrome c maturation protein CcmE [Dictyobacter sp.]|nr:cytochrome c maturation protein CcmE [Dictyobacter sp.]